MSWSRRVYTGLQGGIALKGIVQFKVIDNDVVYDLRLDRNITVLLSIPTASIKNCDCADDIIELIERYL